MLTVTTAALDRLSTKLAGKKAADDSAMRFTRKPGGWKLHFDHPRPADETFIHEGKKVLVLNERASKGMANMTLEVANTEVGPRLKLRGVLSSES
ncbi:MAG: hypothetical protein AABZ12_04320 [Planctomycetota bacterium]